MCVWIKRIEITKIIINKFKICSLPVYKFKKKILFQIWFQITWTPLGHMSSTLKIFWWLFLWVKTSLVFLLTHIYIYICNIYSCVYKYIYIYFNQLNENSLFYLNSINIWSEMMKLEICINKTGIMLLNNRVI